MFAVDFARGPLDSVANPAVWMVADMALHTVKLQLRHSFASSNTAFIAKSSVIVESILIIIKECTGNWHALPRLRVTREMQEPSTLHNVKTERNEHAVNTMLEKVSVFAEMQVKAVTFHLIIRE